MSTKSVDKINQSVNKEENFPSKSEDRSSLLKTIGKAIGLDITKIAIPVKYNEPFSFLQKMMEYIQYIDLLEEASQAEDPRVRALYVAVFSISCYANTSRTSKPFNPLLGETFEFEDNKRQLKFLAEQVSHHPPIGASHCETPNVIYYQTQAVKTKFLGNSLDVTPTGITKVVLKKWDECYSWSNIQTVVNNLILGKMWIDHFGKNIITVSKNSTQKALPVTVNLNYKKCGWFGRGWRDVEGKVVSSNNKIFGISGKWNDEIYATVDPSFSSSIKHSKIKFDDNSPHLIWKHEFIKCSEERFNKYGWSKFTEELIKLDDQFLLGAPCSDSRLREDRLCLEKGDIKSSSKIKNLLEEAQRSRKKTLEKNKIEYKPRYFDIAKSETIYKYNGRYWTEKGKRIESNAKLNKKANVQDANDFWMVQYHEDWYKAKI